MNLNIVSYLDVVCGRTMSRGYKKKNELLLCGMKDLYKGHRCFIIGNGPSLSSSDLEKIRNEYSFASNRVFKIFPHTGWRPTFYCSQDRKILDSLSKLEIREAVSGSIYSFFIPEFYKKTYKISSGDCKPVYVDMLPFDDKFEFRENVIRGFCNGYTVTYMAMQIAVYLGFNEIYLLGVDHSFPYTKDQNGNLTVRDLSLRAHFYETEQDNFDKDKRTKSNYDGFVTKAYQSAENYSRKSGRFRIYNATRGGCLEVFERVDFDDVVNASN